MTSQSHQKIGVDILWLTLVLLVPPLVPEQPQGFVELGKVVLEVWIVVQRADVGRQELMLPEDVELHV